MTELQFWKKAKQAFENPSFSMSSHAGICLFWGSQDISNRVDRSIARKIQKETKRLGFTFLDLWDAEGKRSSVRLRFINRMIRQSQAKKRRKP